MPTNTYNQSYKPSSAEIETYQKEGVVVLRQAFAPSWLELLREGIEQSCAAPGENFTNHSKSEGAPKYLEEFWSWDQQQGFREFVKHSPCGEIAADLLAAERVNLVMDNWFLREKGATSRAPFHHDISYFDFDGSMCVLWLPLEPITKANCISWVKKSHLWNKLFMRVYFGDGHQNDEPCVINGQTYSLPPEINANPTEYDLISFDLAAGDCVMFDMRTLHGALAESTPTESSTRYTLRMTAEDGRIQYRGDWAMAERNIMEAAGYKNGDQIAGEMFPQLWPKNEV